MDIKHSILNFCKINSINNVQKNEKDYNLDDSCLIVGNKNSELLIFLFNYIYNLQLNSNTPPKIWFITSRTSNEIQQSIPEYFFYNLENPLLFNSVEIKHVHSLEELKAFIIGCTLINHTVFQNKYPDCIIIDNFISFFDDNDKNVHTISKIIALIKNTIISINSENKNCQLIISYETNTESIMEDKLCENKYIFDLPNQQSMPFIYHPIDIINLWIPYRITVKGRASDNYELAYSLIQEEKNIPIIDISFPASS